MTGVLLGAGLPVIYLAGWRLSYGWLKMSGRLRHTTLTRTCDHGMQMIHRGQTCHPEMYDHVGTVAARVLTAFWWPALAPAALIFLAVTKGWPGRDSD